MNENPECRPTRYMNQISISDALAGRINRPDKWTPKKKGWSLVGIELNIPHLVSLPKSKLQLSKIGEMNSWESIRVCELIIRSLYGATRPSLPGWGLALLPHLRTAALVSVLGVIWPAIWTHSYFYLYIRMSDYSKYMRDCFRHFFLS